MRFTDPALESLIAEQREYLQSMASPLPPPLDPSVLLPAETVVLPNYAQCTVRVIRPEGHINGVYLQIHGGGFQFGTAERCDAANSVLARRCNLATVSVDYRLAPEHVYPAPLEDCMAAADWLLNSANAYFGTDVLLIGGESVGATLAIQTLLQLRKNSGRHKLFCAANLVFGIYDFSMTPSQVYARGNQFLSPEVLAGIRTAALPGKSLQELRDETISPLYADLSDMPPAIFSVGTDDSVLDDSLFMAQRWCAAGNTTQLEVYPEAPHLFLGYPTKMAATASDKIADFLQNFC